MEQNLVVCWPKNNKSCFFHIKTLFALNQFERFDKSLFIYFGTFSSNKLDCVMFLSSVKWYVFENLVLLCKSFI